MQQDAFWHLSEYGVMAESVMPAGNPSLKYEALGPPRESPPSFVSGVSPAAGGWYSTAATRHATRDA